MKNSEYTLIKLEADDGKVFDWAEPRYNEDENGNQIQEHLYAKVLYLGSNDVAANYIEVEEPAQ